MIFTATELEGAFIIDIERREDERGFFARTFCQREFREHGLNSHIAQANISYSASKGTLRGMHYQALPHQEAKLVTCTKGAIFDVIIDLRRSSPTYKEWVCVELTAGSERMLYVPEDFAHGFLTLEDSTIANYRVSEFYHPDSEKGIRWNDPSFKIAWPFEPAIISQKDTSHPDFEEKPKTLTMEDPAQQCRKQNEPGKRKSNHGSLMSTDGKDPAERDHGFENTADRGK